MAAGDSLSETERRAWLRLGELVQLPMFTDWMQEEIGEAFITCFDPEERVSSEEVKEILRLLPKALPRGDHSGIRERVRLERKSNRTLWLWRQLEGLDGGRA